MFLLIAILILSSEVFLAQLPSESLRNVRVVGGQKAVEGQFPYMVALRASYRPREHGCGGFIIASRWIGSVAHCMRHPNAHMLTIAVVGTTRTSVGGTVYRFSYWLNHPDYVVAERMNDIGIGRTRSEIVFTTLVQPIPLGSEFIGAGVRATISGWGTLDFPLPIGQFAEDLHWVTLTTVTNEVCKERMIPTERHRIYDKNICTYDGVGVGACNGDSGSPLTAGGYVIGAVSWALPCAREFSLSSRRNFQISFKYLISWITWSLSSHFLLSTLDDANYVETFASYL